MWDGAGRASLAARPPPSRTASTSIRLDIMRIPLAALMIAGAVTVAACSDTTTTPTAAIEPAAAQGAAFDETPGLIGHARGATARYLDASVALADGYLPMSPCVAIPSGAMGVHYVKPALLMDAGMDVEQPEALVYEPQQDGSLRLVALEYLILKAPWDAAHPGAAPSFLGQGFDVLPGPAGDMYALHVWAWRQNPNGIFAPFNPKASCPSGASAASHTH